MEQQQKQKEQTECEKQQKARNRIALVAILAIMAIALGLRLYYYSLDPNHTTWWDESEYMSAAKHIASGGTMAEWIAPSRSPGLPYLLSPFFIFGLGETGINIFNILLSVATVYIFYLVAKKLYDQKTALIAAALSAVSWVSLFWSLRVTTDIPAFFLQLVAILFYFKFIEDSKFKNIAIAGVCTAIAMFIRIQTIMLVGTFFLFYIIAKGKALLKSKAFLISAPLLLAACFVFMKTIGKYAMFGIQDQYPIYWGVFNFIGVYLNTTPLIFFGIGLVSLLFSLALSFDLIVMAKTTKIPRSDLFLFLMMLLWFSFVIFYLRSAEERWLLALTLPMFIIAARGLTTVYNFINKYVTIKVIGLIVVVLLLGFGMIAEVHKADSLIRNKIGSYKQVKDAGLWIKANSAPGDVVFSRSAPQNAYYSERETINFDEYKDGTEFTAKILGLKPSRSRHFLQI